MIQIDSVVTSPNKYEHLIYVPLIRKTTALHFFKSLLHTVHVDTCKSVQVNVLLHVYMNQDFILHWKNSPYSSFCIYQMTDFASKRYK